MIFKCALFIILQIKVPKLDLTFYLWIDHHNICNLAFARCNLFIAMAIWFHEEFDDRLQQMQKGNILEQLGIEITEVGDDFVKGKMPVDHRTHQPTGLLHGGASVVLAESLGSVGANLIVDNSKHLCVGLEVNANHIRSVREGFVYGVATPVNIGGKIHVWSIDITNEAGKIVCSSRLTMAVINI